MLSLESRPLTLAFQPPLVSCPKNRTSSRGPLERLMCLALQGEEDFHDSQPERWTEETENLDGVVVLITEVT